jgi:hypothetical protein
MFGFCNALVVGFGLCVRRQEQGRIMNLWSTAVLSWVVRFGSPSWFLPLCRLDASFEVAMKEMNEIVRMYRLSRVSRTSRRATYKLTAAVDGRT